MHLTFGTERFFWRWRKLKPDCGSMWERCSRTEPLDLPSGGWCPPPSMMMMMMMMMMSPTFKISNMRDNTARHYCVTLIQRQSVWELNWRLESLELSMFTLTQNVSTEKMENNCERQTLMFMLLLTLVASPWTTETSKEFARLSSLCLEWSLVFIGR